MIPRHLNLKKNVIFALVAFGVNIGLVFISYRLLILQGGIQAVGLWSTLFAWTSLIRIGDVGMANATIRFAAMHDMESESEKIREYVETGIISNGALFCFLAVLGYIVFSNFVGGLVEQTHVAEAEQVLPVMFGGFFLMNFANVILGSIQGLHLGFVNSQLTVLGNLVQIGAAVFLVPRYGVLGMAWAQVIQYSSMSVVGWYVARRAVSSRNIVPARFSIPAFREMLGFSLRSQVANVSNGLFEPLSKILVSHFGGLQVQGLYELAYKTLWLPRTAVISGVSAMIPSLTHLFRTDREKLWPIYSKSVTYSTLAVLALSIGAVVASPVISWLWIGRVEINYTYFVAIFAVGIVLNAFGAAAYNLAIVTGELRYNIVINVLVLATLAVLGGICGYFLPIHAVVAATAFSMGAGGLAIKFHNERLLQPGRASGGLNA
ncbi:lipopolysaccharide biosynthesis protein [Rhizobium puerariae]|uniref:Lipopolysaccharide biosynthesis protein n=1 Tax=Rhizobium puerariae TaxID=1585791 RepID=A0ABV6AI41_9HYPH